MKKFIWVVLVLSFALLLSGCQASFIDRPDDNAKLLVAVGIVPEATFVERVAGGLVDVVTLIPPGYSPANYQPTAAEMQALSNAKIYFTLQMPTEEANILPKVKDFNEHITIINLREHVQRQHGLLQVQSHDHRVTHHNGTSLHDETMVDPHLWLSPKRAMIMVQTIADELSKLDPDYEDIYQANAKQYIQDLKGLNERVKATLEALESRAFLIYHGAYGYFADDYDLDMIAIEIGGKKATATDIQGVIEEAKAHGITYVLYQEEFDDSQAQTIAEEIGGKVIKVAPLSADYMDSLGSLVEALTAEEETDDE